ncbi:hypothetical protein [uncultured Spirosoma sp.]|uniref:hypothetical protein n=1 Tax=uncultured Spirosoma sp. TaxID=278208 RepID=UPI00258C50E7|nr:hypothetical protein [uncultured Spirosoma sp.]
MRHKRYLHELLVPHTSLFPISVLCAERTGRTLIVSSATQMAIGTTGANTDYTTVKNKSFVKRPRYGPVRDSRRTIPRW